MLLTDELSRWRLPVRLRAREPEAFVVVSGVAISAASCLARAMSFADGSRFFRNPPGVAVLASDCSRTVRSPVLNRENPPASGEIAD